MSDAILEVKNLRTYFYTPEKEEIPAVDNVSFSIKKGETLCLVGESGCGKSVTSLSIIRLVATPPGKYVSGEILFEGTDLLKISPQEMRKKRCSEISMIFQEPMTALNPVHRIGKQISEALLINEDISKAEAYSKTIQLLKEVGVPDPERCAKSFPHQLSGGMRQRVMIAMAISCNPKLLIADEPTTALDVTIQAQILDLINQLKEKHGMTVLFITHDLGVVSDIAQRVVVMYAGHVVEEASCEELFADPRHPYTKGLLSCIPRIDEDKKELSVVEGQVPSPANFPKGCRFHPRCPLKTDLCEIQEPDTYVFGNHKVTCHLYRDSI